MLARYRSMSGIALIILLLIAASAQGEDRPVQLSLLVPVQLFPDTDRISGVRLNLIYGRNASVTGLDLGLINHTTTGESVGVQLGLVSLADADFMGWQYNPVNVVRNDFEGFQWGLVNYAERANGLQLGLVNYEWSADRLGQYHQARRSVPGFPHRQLVVLTIHVFDHHRVDC